MLIQGIAREIRFGVIFEDDLEAHLDRLLTEGHKLTVFFFNSLRMDLLGNIQEFGGNYLLRSDIEEVRQEIMRSDPLQSRTFDNLEQFLRHVIYLLPTIYPFLTTKAVEGQLEAHLRKAKELLKQVENGDKRPNFSPCLPNYATLHQLLSVHWQEIFHAFDPPVERRGPLLRESIALLIRTLYHLTDFDHEGRSFAGRLPATILVAPYHNPDFSAWQKESLRHSPLPLRKVLANTLKAMHLEQDTETYEFRFDPQNVETDVGFQIAMSLKKEYGEYLDTVSYLHTTFEAAPYIRLPMKGRSLNKELSQFSPRTFRRRSQLQTTLREVRRVGQLLAGCCPHEILRELDEKISRLVAITDLPIEWLWIEGVPLGFLVDVCRLPETLPTSILSQFSRNCLTTFSISEEILRHTLVVSGTDPNDPATVGFNLLRTSSGKESYIPDIQLSECRSKQQFFDVLREERPHLLVVNCHGDYVTNEEGTRLQMGSDIVTGWDIIELNQQVPLVVLACCWASPMFGNSNTIAQAFFETGSFSVLSTFLPISVLGGFRIYYRILRNLAYVCKNPEHESWMGLISHTLRTSYFDDKLDRVFQYMDRSRDEFVSLSVGLQVDLAFLGANP